jgi:hypothetical protein
MFQQGVIDVPINLYQDALVRTYCACCTPQRDPHDYYLFVRSPFFDVFSPLLQLRRTIRFA